jgi:hypothetical protein
LVGKSGVPLPTILENEWLLHCMIVFIDKKERSSEKNKVDRNTKE